jgi:hypothetical protein
MNKSLAASFQLTAALGFLWIGYQACLAFYDIAANFGKFILPWKLSFLFFCFFTLIALSIVLFYIWLPEKCHKRFSFVVTLREKFLQSGTCLFLSL